jgi:hypothetical protein
LRDKCLNLMLSGKKGCDSEVARIAGVSRQAVNEYRRRHLSKALNIAQKLQAAELHRPQDVTAQLARTAQITKDVAGVLPILAVRENRINAMQERHDRMRMVMEERAVDMATVPGGKSGLLTRQYKQVGSGETARVVEEYKLDTGLLGEFREHERAVAEELGQIQTAAGMGGPSVAIQIVCPASREQPAVSVNDDGAVTIDIGK